MDLLELNASLLDINSEFALQREIKDIIDELDIMLHLTRQQKEVIKRFIKLAERMMDPDGKLSVGSWDMGSDDTRPSMPTPGKPDGLKGDEEANADKFQWFRKGAYELLVDVCDRISEIQALLKTAETTSHNVSVSIPPLVSLELKTC
jgi:hypothetical protein